MTSNFGSVTVKIAISGSAGIGKTTLAKALAQSLGLPLIAEGYAPLFDLPAAPPAELVPRFEKILRDKSALEASHQAYVADRASTDLFNLWLSLGLGQLPQETEKFYRACREHSQCYDYVVLLPWGVFSVQPIKNTGNFQQRADNPWIQLRNHATICGLNALWLPEARLIHLSQQAVSTEERLTAIKQFFVAS